MEEASWEKAVGKMRAYLDESMQGVFFVAFDRAEDLRALLRETSQCKKVRLSQYCQIDSKPALDNFWSDVDACASPQALLGIGEYFALTGDDWPLRKLAAMLNKGSRKKVIVPVWNGYEFLECLERDVPDDRVADTIVCLKRGRKGWRFINYHVPGAVDCSGFRALLAELEQGCDRQIRTSTRVGLKRDWGTNINSGWQLYCDLHPDTRVPQSMFTENEWRNLVGPDHIADKSFFGAKNLLDLLEKGVENAWLAYVLAKTKTSSDFRDNFINLFLELKPDQPGFSELAQARRDMLQILDESDMAAFIIRLRQIQERDRLPFLSDSTLAEKQEIVRIVKKHPDTPLRGIYDDLAKYQEDYFFSDMKDEYLWSLTQYFIAYKKAKLANIISDEFESQVREYARSKCFLRLPTRGEIMGKLDDGKRALFWLDSLGCEFLGFITAIAGENDMEVRIQTARANLPTITSENNGCRKDWKGDVFCTGSLDKIRHGGDERLPAWEIRQFPLHLPLELAIVKDVVVRIAGLLKSRQYENVVLTSDHGATRLAVIADKEHAWEMPEKGKHGGRCCRVTDAGTFKPACAVSDDAERWYVLADYSRFKGGRQGAVELHGGATLEEVVVPVIELTLRKTLPQIGIIGAWRFRPRLRDTSITLAIHSSLPLKQPSLRITGRVYVMQAGENPGDYEARIALADVGAEDVAIIYDGDVPISGELPFTVSRGVRRNSLDDEF